MNKNIYIFIFSLLIISIISCETERDKEKQKDNVYNTDTLELLSDSIKQIDTNAVNLLFLLELEEAHTQNLLLYDYRDSITDEGSYDINYAFVSEKFNFDGDSIEDYLVVASGSHHMYGYFVNGKKGSIIKTGSFFNEGQVGNMFWHRPYPNENEDGLEFKIIDVNCEDNQNELMVIYSQGAPGKNYKGYSTYLLIYRFDADSIKGDIIFNELIMEDWLYTKNTSLYLDKTNYIDILYNNVNCFSEIKIQQGIRSDTITDNWRKASVSPDKDSDKIIYKFNETINKFEIISE